jgi:NAD(P)-dependent dehydrogenase (short-subunit alcohol dehydrogenase family)
MRGVIVVTGANKGIGYEIVKGLCAQELPETDILLTSRSETLGKAAVQQLQQEGFEPKYHQLDITDRDSVLKLKDYIQSTYGTVLGFINNAGFAFKNNATEPFAVQARESVRINFFGTLLVIKELSPLLERNARIVNVASMAGSLKILSPPLQEEVTREDLTEEQLVQFMQRFVTDVEEGVHEKKGWPNSAYGMSKLGVVALTRICARNVSDLRPTDGILINCCCPGWCKSDMAGWERPTKTAAEGADTPIFLVLLPESSAIQGQFLSDRQERGW